MTKVRPIAHLREPQRAANATDKLVVSVQSLSVMFGDVCERCELFERSSKRICDGCERNVNLCLILARSCAKHDN